ncbi:acetate/propionate family kinase [Georgenia sp. Z1491]|uniref:acetate/propionate family kinase n=1 Tax=Georgenia sp. Z1491 TaxID=3416707 RepID=UPI003CE8D676
MSGTVLVVNSGSSSIKYQLVDPDTADVVASGLLERIGEVSGHLRHTTGDGTTERDLPVPDHTAGLAAVLEAFDELGPVLADAGIRAVGHRVVQGGAEFSGPVELDDDAVERIDALSPLAPLHNPGNVAGIRVARELVPDVPHVAVFDTAFFADLPAAAATYALERTTAERYAVKRYGAHGTSHELVSRAVSERLGRDDLRQIVLHLGNGASASAVRAGRAVDTSMGLTPLEGLVMGTRTGDIDPAVAFHLHRVGGLDVAEIDDLFNKRSGLKGMTGHNDMREVRELAGAGDADARLALDVYAHRLRKYIGAYAAVMGGLDAVTFTAGVGENDALIRAEVLAPLAFLGIELDDDANTARSGEPRVISTPGSAVTVLVVPTNEELAIARQTIEVSGA